VRRIK